MESCPCGSQRAFAECCEPALTGTRPAPTAEQLMRARYSAYATTNVGFIMTSTHPDKRKDCDENAIRKWSEGSEWHGLEVLGTSKGGPSDVDGEVEFVAHFTEDRMKKRLHEKAVFKKVDGLWVYYDGQIQPTKPFVRAEARVSRNDPCPCGSGKKYKKCCA